MNRYLLTAFFGSSALVYSLPFDTPPATGAAPAAAAPSSAPAAASGGSASGGAEVGMTTDLSLPADKKSGQMTFYTFWNTGPMSCGVKPDPEGYIAALPAAYMKAACGKCIKIVCGGKAAIVKALDTCPECPEVNVDTSDVLFERLVGDKGKGRVQMEWGFVECGSGNPTAGPAVSSSGATPAGGSSSAPAGGGAASAASDAGPVQSAQPTQAQEGKPGSVQPGTAIPNQGPGASPPAAPQQQQQQPTVNKPIVQKADNSTTPAPAVPKPVAAPAPAGTQTPPKEQSASPAAASASKETAAAPAKK